MWEAVRNWIGEGGDVDGEERRAGCLRRRNSAVKLEAGGGVGTEVGTLRRRDSMFMRQLGFLVTYGEQGIKAPVPLLPQLQPLQPSAADPGTFVCPELIRSLPWEEEHQDNTQEVHRKANNKQSKRRNTYVSFSSNGVGSGSGRKLSFPGQGLKPESRLKEARLLRRRTSMPPRKINKPAEVNMDDNSGASEKQNAWEKLRASRARIFAISLFMKLYEDKIYGFVSLHDVDEEGEGDDEKAELWLEPVPQKEKEDTTAEENNVFFPGVSEEAREVYKICYHEKLHDKLTEVFPKHKKHMVKRSETPTALITDITPRNSVKDIDYFQKMLDALKVTKSEQFPREAKDMPTPRKLIGRYNSWTRDRMNSK